MSDSLRISTSATESIIKSPEEALLPSALDGTVTLPAGILVAAMLSNDVLKNVDVGNVSLPAKTEGVWVHFFVPPAPANPPTTHNPGGDLTFAPSNAGSISLINPGGQFFSVKFNNSFEPGPNFPADPDDWTGYYGYDTRMRILGFTSGLITKHFTDYNSTIAGAIAAPLSVQFIELDVGEFFEDKPPDPGAERADGSLTQGFLIFWPGLTSAADLPPFPYALGADGNARQLG
jgi:hypothetical protein